MGRKTIPLSEHQLKTLYWDKDMSILKISQELGVSYETVRKRMQLLGISRRPSGPAKLGLDRSECDNGHPLDDTNRYVSSSGRVTCLTCRNAHSRQYYFSNHKKCLDKARGQSRLKRFGMTAEMYNQMVTAQDGLCALCKRPEKDTSPSGKVKALAVDHNHLTGEVRGLLCKRCNCALGMLDDNPELFELAIAYLGKACKGGN